MRARKSRLSRKFYRPPWSRFAMGVGCSTIAMNSATPYPRDTSCGAMRMFAESFGAMGLKAESPDALRQVLRQAFAANAPVLIEVPCGEMPSPWEFIMLPRSRPSTGSA